MKHNAIISTNNNKDYLFCLPLVIQSWNLQGWNTHTVMVEVDPRVYDLVQYYTKPEVNLFYAANDIKFSTVNPALFTQCTRLYWPQALLLHDEYFILSDADMFICSSFLNRDFDKVNVFGHDLTGYEQIPVCYVGAQGKEWDKIMGNQGLRNDLITYAQPSADFFKAWGADQDILTGKIGEYASQYPVNFIKRGTDPDNEGLPLGRFDRHNLQMPEVEIHDAHLMRAPYAEGNFQLLTDFVRKIYPEADWGWLPVYRREFLKLVQNDTYN
jgi:hypothetical protein